MTKPIVVASIYGNFVLALNCNFLLTGTLLFCFRDLGKSHKPLLKWMRVFNLRSPVNEEALLYRYWQELTPRNLCMLDTSPERFRYPSKHKTEYSACTESIRALLI